MLSSENLKHYHAIITFLQSDADDMDLNQLNDFILNLEENQFKELEVLFLSNKKLKTLQFSVAHLNEDQLIAFARFMNRLYTPGVLTLRIKTLGTADVANLAYLFKTINDGRIKHLDLSSLNLGKLTIEALQPLLEVLSQTRFESINLNDNGLSRLQEHCVVFFESLIRSTHLKFLSVNNNALSKLSLNVLEKLHECHYAHGMPLQFWPSEDNKRAEEFVKEPLDDETKIALAKLILKQSCSRNHAYEKEPLPYTLNCSRQYFELFSDVIDLFPQKESNDMENSLHHFSQWIRSRDWGITTDEKLALYNKLITKFPDFLRYQNVFKLNYSEVSLSEEAAHSYANYLWQEYQDGLGKNTHLFTADLSPFELSSAFIDNVCKTLSANPNLCELRLSLKNSSDDLIKYFSEAFAKVIKENNGRYFSIVIKYLDLSTDEDMYKLALFLQPFPEHYMGKLQLPNANMGLMSFRQAEQFHSLNLFYSLDLSENDLGLMGYQLPAFLRHLKPEKISVSLDSLRYINISELADAYKNTKNELVVGGKYSGNPLDVARATLQLEGMSSRVYYPFLTFKLTNQQYVDVLREFIRTAPRRAAKVETWIGYHQRELQFDYADRLLLAKEYVAVSKAFDQDIKLSGYGLRLEDQLLLLLDFYESQPQLASYTKLNDFLGRKTQGNDSLITNAKTVEQILSSVCKNRWPHLDFYQHAIKKLFGYKIEEEYDATKLVNMLAWFTWLIINLSDDKYERLRHMTILHTPEGSAFGTDLDNLEHLVNEILNIAEPDLRIEISKSVFFILENSKALEHFNHLSAMTHVRNTLPSLYLALILSANQDDLIQAELNAKALSILKLISNKYTEGRYQQSLINGLRALSALVGYTSLQKLSLIYSVLSSNEADAAKQFIDNFLVTLLEGKHDILAITYKQKMDDLDLPSKTRAEMEDMVKTPSPITKDKVRKLKRQWQAQIVSHYKNTHFLQQINLWWLIQGLCMLNKIEEVFRSDHIEDAVLNAMVELFDLSLEQKNRYRHIMGSYPNQSALLTYLSKLMCLDERVKMPLLAVFKNFVKTILSPDSSLFYQARYDLEKSLHLRTIFSERPLLLKQWQRGSRCDFEQFLKSHPVEVGAFKFDAVDAERFIIEKIYLHQHLKLHMHHLEQFVKEKNAESKSVVKEHLTTLCQSVKDDTLDFQLGLIELMSTPNLSEQEQMRLLRKAYNSLQAMDRESEFLSDLSSVMDALSASNKKIKPVDRSKWTLVDTDNFWHLFTCGNLPGSCQRIDGNPALNKALLGYLVNGKNRLLAIVNEKGELFARCIFRILWDKTAKQPVLFVESIYAEPSAASYADVLLAFAKMRARDLNLALVKNDRWHTEGAKYGNRLFSLDGSAPWEYVDAIHTQVKDGVYSINGSTILEQSIKPQLARRASLDGLVRNTMFAKKNKEIKSSDDFALNYLHSL